jgi:iron complex transport system substrate-binding protein
LRQWLYHSIKAFALLLFCNSVCDAAPKRIVSINLCTDQLLLMLAPRQHILSVSHLAADPAYSFMSEQAQGIPGNDGLVEQVIPLQPDLILAGDYSSTEAVSMLKKLGYPVQVIPLPQSMSDISSFTLKIGKLLEQEEKAEQLLFEMNHRIEKVQEKTESQSKKLAVIYAPNGFTAGTKTFMHELLSLAGYRNLASEIGIDFYGNLSVEQILAAQPEVMVVDDSTSNQDSLAQSYTNHPALKRLLGEAGIIKLPVNQSLCGGPMAADAIETLAQIKP